MKYAVISDIHGNYPALSAVLKDAEIANVDGFIFAGDYATGFPYPNPVVSKIMSIQNSRVICGNGEGYIKDLAGKNISSRTDGQFRALYWCFRTLTEENRSFLISLPKRADFQDGGVEVHVAHASEEFIGNVERREFSPMKVAVRYGGRPFSHDMLQRDIGSYLMDDPDFQGKLKSLSDGVYIFGHTHLQWHARFGSKIFLNPGSCGEPLDFSTEGARYTILEIRQGLVSVDERLVRYDKAALVEDYKKTTLYSYEPVLSQLAIQNLVTGISNTIFFLRYAEEYAQKTGDPVRPYSVATWENAYQNWTDDNPSVTNRKGK